MRSAVFLSVLALAGIAASAALAGPHHWFRPNPYVITDDSEIGRLNLGVDIRLAGSTPAAVNAFVSGLPPRTRSEVWGGCQTFLTWPGNVETDTLSFCRLLYASR